MYSFENFLDWGLEKEKKNIFDINSKFSKFTTEQLLEKNFNFIVAGRIRSIRNFGNLSFVIIFDQNSNLQLKITDKSINKKIKLGDIIAVFGNLFRTKTGELSLNVQKFKLLTVCKKEIPSVYYGLNDVEESLRKRYLHFIVNPKNKETFFLRSKIISHIRYFLDKKNFLEVETPILVNNASGAQAKPFITFHNKLQRNFFLRIATEIPLKKLLVSGFEKVYEIGRIFRNEGIDSRHNPEFTTIEIYHAYKKSTYMMDLTENIFLSIAKNIFGCYEFPSRDGTFLINLNKKFKRISVLEIIKEKLNLEFNDKTLEEAINLAIEYKLNLEEFQKKSTMLIAFAFFEEFIEKNIKEPTFVYDYPIEISPLSKNKENNNNLADRFEFFIDGMEFANGYTELDDADEQKKRFIEQIKQKELGNEETSIPDEDFVEALEYGMPPAAGLGIGIDRLIMFFTGKKSIKSVIFFPQLKSLDN